MKFKKMPSILRIMNRTIELNSEKIIWFLTRHEKAKLSFRLNKVKFCENCQIILRNDVALYK